MTDEQSRPLTGSLTDLQRTRIDFARREWEYARSEDLAQLDAAGLVLLVEKLRGRLGDMLDLLGEVADTEPPSRTQSDR